ncbi:hypothetical protein IAE29_23215 [Ochrobactrum sp. S46]|nr:hypothetical protein [Ochrobactrum sp. S45]MBK0046236.1 hypothetical protein [Ochrobactrum sp. S46]
MSMSTAVTAEFFDPAKASASPARLGAPVRGSVLARLMSTFCGHQGHDHCSQNKQQHREHRQQHVRGAVVEQGNVTDLSACYEEGTARENGSAECVEAGQDPGGAQPFAPGENNTLANDQKIDGAARQRAEHDPG